MQASPARILCFGDFALDPRAGELRKHGVKIRLQEQSLQILLMLLERRGEVVLRDEIRLKLWPNNTIVEFDHSINATIKRLRTRWARRAEEWPERPRMQGLLLGEVRERTCRENRCAPGGRIELSVFFSIDAGS